ncbi:MAG: rhamnan synthesis F family protein [Burkholderiales bacterium]
MDSPPTTAAAPWAAVVAHYDVDGRVAEHLQRTVRLLQQRGATVCFVSTRLSDAAAAQLAPHAQVIRRDNVGYDFWSYKVGIDALGLPGAFDRLLLLNSSMVVTDPARLLDRHLALAPQTDVLGLTLSHEVQPHLQSFWLGFERAALHSAAFAQWWQTMQPLSDREAVIAQQELGLSAHFARAGLRLGALHRPSRADQLRAVLRAVDNGFLPFDAGSDGPVAIDPAWAERLNPTMYAWDSVFAQLGVLKLELLKRNPHRINLSALRDRLVRDPALQHLLQDAGVSTPSLLGDPPKLSLAQNLKAFDPSLHAGEVAASGLVGAEKLDG